VATARLNAQIRATGRILGIDSGVVVLWIADTRVNQKPNLSELLRIEFDSTSGELRAYAAPSNLQASDDTLYDLATTDFLATTAALKGTANFPYTTIVLHVSNWVISPTTFTSTTRFINYTLTLIDENNATFNARSTVALHAQIDTGT